MFTTQLPVAIHIALQKLNCQLQKQRLQHMSEHIHVPRRAIAIFIIDFWYVLWSLKVMIFLKLCFKTDWNVFLWSFKGKERRQCRADNRMCKSSYILNIWQFSIIFKFLSTFEIIGTYLTTLEIFQSVISKCSELLKISCK